MNSKVKAAYQYTLFAYVAVQAARGWYGLIKDLTLAVKEARARRRA